MMTLCRHVCRIQVRRTQLEVLEQTNGASSNFSITCKYTSFKQLIKGCHDDSDLKLLVGQDLGGIGVDPAFNV